MWCNTLRFSKCLHVNRDCNLVVVTNVLEKYLLEEADVASYTKIFSSHLCKQRQLLISSFPLSKHFSSWHVNKTTTTDFKTSRKQCTQWLTNTCIRLNNCRNHYACCCLKKALWWTAKFQHMHNSAKCPLAHVVQQKNAGSGQKNVCVCVLSAVSMQCKRNMHVNGLRKCLCMHSSALVFTRCKRKTHGNGLKKCLVCAH